VHSRITFYVYVKIGQVNGAAPPPRPPESATGYVRRYKWTENAVMQAAVALLAVCSVQDQQDQFRREKSLPLLTTRNQLRSQASLSYSRFGRNKSRTQSGRKDDRGDQHGRTGRRRARSSKRRTHSVDSDLVRGFFQPHSINSRFGMWLSGLCVLLLLCLQWSAFKSGCAMC